MQNKIYSTLANLYSEVKTARKNKSSLGEAIDDSIANQQEVLNARGGFFDLKTRLDDLTGLLSTVDVKYEALKSDIFNISTKPSEPVKPEIPIVNIDGKDILVSLQNKIAYREDYLTIPPGEQRIVENTNDNNMYDSYIKTNNATAILNKYDFNNESDVLYDSSVNILASKIITPKPTGDLYKLPLNTAKLFSMDQLDAAILINICSVSSDYATPTTNANGSMNYSNHLINALRGDSTWTVDRSFLTVTVVFNRVTPIIKFVNKQHSNTTVCRFNIDISANGTSWEQVYSGGESEVDVTLPSERLVKFIRYTYNSFDGSTLSNKITVSNISLYSTKYNNDSGVVETIKPIPMYEHDSDLKLITTGTTDEDSHVITKFALSNTTDNDDKWATYIPKVYTILPMDFFDDTGLKYVDSVLKNNIKIDANDDVIFAPKSYGNYKLTTVGGTVGDINISLESSISDNNAWKIDDTAYFKVYINIKGVEYIVPLSLSNINKEVVANVSGVDIGIVLSIMNNNTMKAYVYPLVGNTVATGLVADEIRIEIYCAYYMPNGSYPYSQSSMSQSSYTNYIDGFPVNLFEVSNYYRVFYQWFQFWWGWQYSYGTPRSVSGISGAIIPNNMRSSTSTISTITKSIGGATFNVSQIKNVNCSLPANIYMGYGGNSILYNSILSDTTGVTRSIKQPIFTYKKEYKTKVFVSKQGKISKILVDQEISSNDDIRYSISFDDISYYVFNKDTLEWNTHIDNNGMMESALSYPNETFYDKIQCSEWLYIKVIINSPNAKLNSITVQFVDDMFVLIDKNEIYEKGAFKRHIEAIEPQSLTNYLRDDYSILKVAQVAKAIFPIYKYAISGYKIQDYNDVQWERIDLTKVKEYLLPNNSLVYKNISTATQYMKIVRRIIENQVAVIDSQEEDKLKIQEIADKEIMLEQGIDLLQQNITLLHQGMLEGSVPADLPQFILPDITEIDVPILQEGGFYKISDVPKLRGIQVWEEQSSFKQYDEVMIFDSAHADQYTSIGVVIDDQGAVVNSDYDRDNPYYLSEDGVRNSNTKATYPNYDMTISVVPAYNGILSIMENGGSPDWTSSLNFGTDDFGYQFAWRSTKYSVNWPYNVIWNLPGENVRWVDIILDFRNNIWLNYLSDVDYGINNFLNNVIRASVNQITTFSVSLDGKEYIDIYRQTNYAMNQTINFEREIRFLRIRLELPYTVNRGAGAVSFTEMDIYSSPVRYNHTAEFYIYNTSAIDTSKWLNFNQILVDRFIDHNPAEMKFLISDDINRNSWKSWNGTKWVTTTTISLATAMSIETLLSLRDTQLNQLTKGSLYIAAVMKTTDGYKTPVLRKIEFLHDLDTQKYYKMVDLNTIDFKYSQVDKEIIITNDTSGVKKLKIVLL